MSKSNHLAKSLIEEKNSTKIFNNLINKDDENDDNEIEFLIEKSDLKFGQSKSAHANLAYLVIYYKINNQKMYI